MKVVACLGHECSGLCVQQFGLCTRAEQEGEAAKGEGAFGAKAMLRRVMCLSPCHIVILHIELLTATSRCHQTGVCTAVQKLSQEEAAIC